MITEVGPSIRLVRAPNPSPLTLEGTNTYIIGREETIVIDPGPALPAHLEEVAAAAGHVTLVLLTHRHPDHAEGAPAFATMTGAQLAAFGDEPVQGVAPRALRDQEELTVADLRLRVIQTPGHAGDHLSFWLEEERILFTGDHVLGRGTSVIAWPDGDLRAYMASLARARALNAARLLPGHGPAVEDPAVVLDYYAAHRRDREAQVLAAIDGGADTVEDMVEQIYVDVDRSLHGAAALSVRAHLEKLVSDGVLAGSEDGWRRR